MLSEAEPLLWNSDPDLPLSLAQQYLDLGFWFGNITSIGCIKKVCYAESQLIRQIEARCELPFSKSNGFRSRALGTPFKFEPFRLWRTPFRLHLDKCGITSHSPFVGDTSDRLSSPPVEPPQCPSASLKSSGTASLNFSMGYLLSLYHQMRTQRNRDREHRNHADWNKPKPHPLSTKQCPASMHLSTPARHCWQLITPCMKILLLHK